MQATGADPIRPILVLLDLLVLILSASPTLVRLISKVSRRIRWRAPTFASMGLAFSSAHAAKVVWRESPSPGSRPALEHGPINTRALVTHILAAAKGLASY